MKRCVIVGGANISDYKRIKTALKEDDYFIFCDSGLKHRESLGIVPDLVVGDFDSYPAAPFGCETIQLPCEKDDTDTVYGVKVGLERGFQDFFLIGVVGQRIDHSLANISLLLMIHRAGGKAFILDDYSHMEIVSKEPVEIDSSFLYFSLVNIYGIAKGIHIQGGKYPLNGGEITTDYQYGISNQVLSDAPAKVWLEDGYLLLVKIDRE